MDNLTGTILRGYEIHERVAVGGFGVVYRAIQPAIGREVAIKVILPEYAHEPEFIERFTAEAQFIARLAHPFVVPLFDFWSDDSGAYLVMRWLPVTLRKRLEHGIIDLPTTLRIIEQIAGALTVAHRHRVIHRDIKPENILLDEDENAYLTDFGVAKNVSSDSTSRSGNFTGSLGYISPEQIRGTPLTAQTDLYSLGIVLYEMVIGRHPFKSGSLGEMIFKHMEEPLPDISFFNPMLNSVIQRATAKEPSERFESALTFAAALRNVVETDSEPSIQLPVQVDPYRDYLEALDEQITNFLDATVFSMIPLSAQSSTNKVRGAVRQMPISLMPIGSREGTGNAREREPAQTFENFADAVEFYGGKLLLLGEPGAGKSVTMWRYARDAVQARLEDASQPLPLIAQIPTWDGQKLFVEWLSDAIPALSQEDIQSVISSGKALLMLDGLDELGSQRSDPKSNSTFDPRRRFIELIPYNNQVLVSCRIKDYDEIGERIALKGAITLQPLRDEQMEHYLEGYPHLAQAVSRDASLRNMLRTPLLLSLFTFAYSNIADNARNLRDLQSTPTDLRDRVFTTYIDRRFSFEKAKPGAQIQYRIDDLYRVLGYAATQDAIHYTNSIREDIHQLVGRHYESFIEEACRLHLLIFAGNKLRFTHLLVRDYFAFYYAVDLLKNKNNEARAAAAQVLGRIRDPRAVPAMIAALNDKDWSVREAVVQGLGNIADKQAIDSLTPLLKDQNDNVRRAVAISLGQIHDPRVIKPLLRALHDHHSDVRWAAAQMLKHIYDKSAVEALMETLHDKDWDVRRAALDSLKGIQDIPLPLLANALRDKDWEVRRSSVELLGYSRESGAIELLAKGLQDEATTIQWAATDALKRIGTSTALSMLQEWRQRRKS